MKNHYIETCNQASLLRKHFSYLFLTYQHKVYQYYFPLLVHYLSITFYITFSSPLHYLPITCPYLLHHFSITFPSLSSQHLSRAASEASPFTSLFSTGTWSCPVLNSALLHRAATLLSLSHPGEVLSRPVPD